MTGVLYYKLPFKNSFYWKDLMICCFFNLLIVDQLLISFDKETLSVTAETLGNFKNWEESSSGDVNLC